MPNCCIAAGCSNTSNIEGVSLFKFPKDESLKREWIEQVKRTRDKNGMAQQANIPFCVVSTLL